MNPFLPKPYLGLPAGRQTRHAGPGLAVPAQGARASFPKDPCTYIVYTWALKGFLYSSFRAKVHTI